MNELISIFWSVLTVAVLVLMGIGLLRVALWIAIKLFMSCKRQYLREVDPRIAIAENCKAIMKDYEKRN